MECIEDGCRERVHIGEGRCDAHVNEQGHRDCHSAAHGTHRPSSEAAGFDLCIFMVHCWLARRSILCISALLRGGKQWETRPVAGRVSQKKLERSTSCEDVFNIGHKPI